tara:strand:- start:10221 stop:12551 length:2331 start_codon:yes stop_codon:yes gene_type:complete
MGNVLKIGFISIMALALSHSSIRAQTNDTITQKIVGNLHSLAENKAQDLIYVQTSKGIYETEEDLWFKAYVMDAQYLSPSSRSKTLYVQLSHEEDNTVYWQEKYEIIDGFVDGHLFLNDSLPTGDYQLTTYTSHSFLRESEEFNAIRKIKVVDKVENIKASSLSPSTKKEKIIDLLLFPEGGNLISGLRCKLAFKAVNENGKHVEISGSLFENDTPVLEFKSLHAGMGSMVFVPNADKEYRIKLNESDSIYYLPEIQRKGISMYMTAIDSIFMSFNISQSPVSRKQKIYIRVQVRGVAHSIAEGILQKSLKIKIPLKELPQGISEVTLFDEKFRPVAERLVYVNPHKKLNIKATLSDGNEYTSKDKVTLKLKVTDGQGRPVIAHLGVSVHDWIYGNDQDAKNIMTHCYLSTQIKGRIHDPGYYFNKENQQRLEALDYLLLTQGWRRYVWSEANLNNLPLYRIPVVADGIDGEVINNKKNDSDILGQPVLLVYNPVDESQKDFVLLDSLGRFALAPEHLKIGERGYVYLRMMTPQKPKLRINLQDFGFKHIDEVKKSKAWVYPSPPGISTFQGIAEPFRSAPDMVQLDEVEIKARKRTVIREKYLGKLDSIAKMETSDYVCKYNILNCELHANDKDNFKPVEGKIYLYIEYWDGNKWVPGHPRTSGEQFRNPPLPPYRYPKLTDEYLMQKFNIVRSKGYYGRREFYQPNYDTEDSNFLDYRNTLLWDPEVITDINGNATLSFFCSDLNTLFIGTVEGLSGDGLLGNENFEFTVRKGQ